MRPLALALGGLAALLLVLFLASAALDPFAPSTLSYARERAELDRLAREAARAEQLAPLDTAIAAAWRLLPLAVVVAGICYAAALGVAALARFRHERNPDARGLLPVPALDRDAPRAALASYHAAHVEAARRPAVPHSLTYSPHHSYRADAGRAALPPADELLPAPGAAVPSFGELLNQGRIGRGNPMLLGFDSESGAAVEGSWLDLYSAGVGGLSGSGKSWTVCYLAAQASLFGTRIVLLDPHAAHEESLTARLAPMASRFLCSPAESPREMRAAVELVAEELRRRKAGHRGDPLLFVADEYSSLQRGELAEPLAALVEALGQEGRKLGLYALVAGQVWTASRAGGTEVRDSLASAFVHRCRPAQARYLTGMTAADLPGDLLELPAGSCYLLNTAGDFRRLTIPRMAPGDMARVAQLLDGPQASGRAVAGPASRPLGFSPPAGNPPAARPWPGDGPATGRDAATAAGSANGPLDAEAAALLAKLAAGATVHDLAVELAGESNPGSRRYKAARARVETLLQQLAAERLGKVASDAQ